MAPSHTGVVIGQSGILPFAWAVLRSAVKRQPALILGQSAIERWHDKPGAAVTI